MVPAPMVRLPCAQALVRPASIATQSVNRVLLEQIPVIMVDDVVMDVPDLTVVVVRTLATELNLSCQIQVRVDLNAQAEAQAWSRCRRPKLRLFREAALGARPQYRGMPPSKESSR